MVKSLETSGPEIRNNWNCFSNLVDVLSKSSHLNMLYLDTGSTLSDMCTNVQFDFGSNLMGEKRIDFKYFTKKSLIRLSGLLHDSYFQDENNFDYPFISVLGLYYSKLKVDHGKRALDDFYHLKLISVDSEEKSRSRSVNQFDFERASEFSAQSGHIPILMSLHLCKDGVHEIMNRIKSSYGFKQLKEMTSEESDIKRAQGITDYTFF